MYDIFKPYWKSIRSKDMFGYLITLNFNRRGQYHKTQIGGLFSVCIKFFIYVYVLLNFNTMFSLKANKNTTINSIETFEEIGKINLNETQHFIFYNLRS